MRSQILLLFAFVLPPAGAASLTVERYLAVDGGVARAEHGAGVFECENMNRGVISPEMLRECLKTVRVGAIIFETEYFGDPAGEPNLCVSMRAFARATGSTTCLAYGHLVENKLKECHELSTESTSEDGRCHARSVFVLSVKSHDEPQAE